jgi:hypothetical protein
LSAATRESPASAVYVTLKKVFGVVVLIPPIQAKIPRFVDGIVFYDVVDRAERRPQSRATTEK